ncbi:hypothetical protein [Sphingobacterium humi]|uniref:Uncharacterized protein n=1 Tax=Sphingobacterium humi TaxID=1796905 RepID=A0A6N8L2U0_9SPHI|nr:hypothetical protein [Sphingobacterium humi]MVZ63656.1 hypothetical protein [Sphingobacterium humi]
MENKKPYETPYLKVYEVELEYGIAAASINDNSMSQSWEDSSSSHDVEW